jgi:hypothetical protein
MNRPEEDEHKEAETDGPLDVLPVEVPREAIQATPSRLRRPVSSDTENKDVTQRIKRRPSALAAERSALPWVVSGIFAGILLLAGLTIILWWLWPNASDPSAADPALSGMGKTRSIEGWGTLTDLNGDCGSGWTRGSSS